MSGSVPAYAMFSSECERRGTVVVNQQPLLPTALRGVELRVLRAREHLQELDKHIQDYLVSKPYRLTVQPDAALSVYRITVHHTPPPLELAAIVGDVLHNLRSALDHLARQLVLAHGGVPVDGGGGGTTTFPITSPEFDPARRRGPVKVAGGIAPAALQLLESLQADQQAAPDQDPLWLLHHLNNIDKHRTLHLTAFTGTSSVAFRADGDQETITDATSQYDVRLDLNSEQLIYVEPAGFCDEVMPFGQFSTTVMLADVEGQPTLTSLLGQIHRHVVDVVAQFLVFFVVQGESQSSAPTRVALDHHLPEQLEGAPPFPLRSVLATDATLHGCADPPDGLERALPACRASRCTRRTTRTNALPCRSDSGHRPQRGWTPVVTRLVTDRSATGRAPSCLLRRAAGGPAGREGGAVRSWRQRGPAASAADAAGVKVGTATPAAGRPRRQRGADGAQQHQPRRGRVRASRPVTTGATPARTSRSSFPEGTRSLRDLRLQLDVRWPVPIRAPRGHHVTPVRCAGARAPVPHVLRLALHGYALGAPVDRVHGTPARGESGKDADTNLRRRGATTRAWDTDKEPDILQQLGSRPPTTQRRRKRPDPEVVPLCPDTPECHSGFQP